MTKGVTNNAFFIDAKKLGKPYSILKKEKLRPT